MENLNRTALKEPITFCGAAKGNSICVNPQGKIFGCGYSIYDIGQIIDMKKFFLQTTSTQNMFNLIILAK